MGIKTMNSEPDKTTEWPQCFTHHDLSASEKPPEYEDREQDRDLWLFSALVSVQMSHQEWYERYMRRYFAEDNPWVMCIREAESARCYGIGPLRLGAWCHAPADSNLSTITTALLRKWFFACAKHGELEVHFVEEQSDIPIDFDVVWGDL